MWCDNLLFGVAEGGLKSSGLKKSKKSNVVEGSLLDMYPKRIFWVKKTKLCQKQQCIDTQLWFMYVKIVAH